MKVELSKEEAALIQFAIVSTDELWKPSKEGHWYEPADELVERVLEKMAEVLDET